MGERVVRLPREVGILAVAATVYFGGRVAVEGAPASALGNARRLLDVERWIGLDIELGLQDWVLRHDLVQRLGNASYVWLHWPLVLVCLGVLLAGDEAAAYRRCRNALIISGAIGLVLFAVVPMSPPRFLPEYVGTVSEEARRHYLDYPLSWTNRHAAFPSFHAAWTMVACLAVRSVVESRLARAVLLLPGPIVAVAAVTTGNHYILDSAAGILLALAAYELPAWRHRRQEGSVAPATDRSPADADRQVHPSGSMSTPGRRPLGGHTTELRPLIAGGPDERKPT